MQAPNAGGPGSIPSQGTRSHMAQLKSSYTATKNNLARHSKEQRPRSSQVANKNWQKTSESANKNWQGQANKSIN